MSSAASDWSRLPLGTLFRVRETGKLHVVDDYGSAMVGRDKVDLYKPDYKSVNEWGVRSVTLDVLKWGDWQRSLAVLRPRARYAHVREMVRSLETRPETRIKHRPDQALLGPHVITRVDNPFEEG